MLEALIFRGCSCLFMALKREGAVFLLGIAILAVIIALLFLPRNVEAELLRLSVRSSALYGYLFLSVTALLTPFLREVTRAFGRPFLKVHHSFAVLGFVLITLHPVFNAMESVNLSVFVPRFDSWYLFWLLAGRPALILFYGALFAALLRRKIMSYWRVFHALMYVVLFFGLVHAALIGADFQNLDVTIVFFALFFASLAGFGFKRFRHYQLKRRINR
jgi:sulfoxide reductase heme-binding subunit YedZ